MKKKPTNHMVPFGEESKTPIQISVRTCNAIVNRGIVDLDSLLQWTPLELNRRIKGMGPKSIAEIRAALAVHGLKLLGDNTPSRPRASAVRVNKRAWYRRRVQLLLFDHGVTVQADIRIGGILVSSRVAFTKDAAIKLLREAFHRRLKAERDNPKTSIFKRR